MPVDGRAFLKGQEASEEAQFSQRWAQGTNNAIKRRAWLAGIE